MVASRCECPSCGQIWATTGLSYPDVDLSGMETVRLYVTPRCEPVDQFEKLRKGLVTYLKRDVLLMPGTTLGPYDGKTSGVFPDLAFGHPWELFIKESALSAIKQSGLHMLGVWPV